jgi:hypothetical protein
MENERGNPKFCFLVTGGPFNSYYMKKVRELKTSLGKFSPNHTDILGKEEPAVAAAPETPAVEAPKRKGKVVSQETKSIVHSLPQRLFYSRRKLKNATPQDLKFPQENFTVDMPPSLTALDVYFT